MAQSVEQLIRNQQVGGSSPPTSSKAPVWGLFLCPFSLEFYLTCLCIINTEVNLLRRYILARAGGTGARVRANGYEKRHFFKHLFSQKEKNYDPSVLLTIERFY